MQLKTLNEALQSELADLYDAEKQLVERLPELVRETTNTSLRAAVENHLEETKTHVQRLEQIFQMMGSTPEPDRCEAMKGLLDEIENVINSSGDKLVKDAVLIGAIQRVEHYEIAGYGTARAFAEQLELDDIAELLQETLDEEGIADRKLTSLAEGGLFTGGVNAEASHAGQ